MAHTNSKKEVCAMESNISSKAMNLPKSCRSTMDNMVNELEKEDQTYQIANLPQSCCDKIAECEQELNKQGYWNIALVAYQMDK